MTMIRFGEQARLLLLVLATSDQDNPEPLSAAEWEAACTTMGLQLAFRGNLPPSVSAECHRTMAEVSRRTGLPLHFAPLGEGPEKTH